MINKHKAMAEVVEMPSKGGYGTSRTPELIYKSLFFCTGSTHCGKIKPLERGERVEVKC